MKILYLIRLTRYTCTSERQYYVLPRFTVNVKDGELDYGISFGLISVHFEKKKHARIMLKSLNKLLSSYSNKDILFTINNSGTKSIRIVKINKEYDDKYLFIYNCVKNGCTERKILKLFAIFLLGQ